MFVRQGKWVCRMGCKTPSRDCNVTLVNRILDAQIDTGASAGTQEHEEEMERLRVLNS